MIKLVNKDKLTKVLTNYKKNTKENIEKNKLKNTSLVFNDCKYQNENDVSILSLELLNNSKEYTKRKINSSIGFNMLTIDNTDNKYYNKSELEEKISNIYECTNKQDEEEILKQLGIIYEPLNIFKVSGATVGEAITDITDVNYIQVDNNLIVNPTSFTVPKSDFTLTIDGDFTKVLKKNSKLSLGIYEIDEFGNNNICKSNKPAYTKITTININKLFNCTYLFYNCSRLTTINGDMIIDDSVTDCGYMFYGCDSLLKLPDSFILSDNVTNCSNMFYDCNKLNYIPSTFILPNSVSNCVHMFSNCSSLDENSFSEELLNSMLKCNMHYESLPSSIQFKMRSKYGSKYNGLF